MGFTPKIHLTTDAIVIAKVGHQLDVLLIKRKQNPFQNQWALPGGFLEESELVVNACQRELQEETGLYIDQNHFKFVNYYDALKRDPRSRTISFAFAVQLEDKPKVKGNDDAAEAVWFSIGDLPQLAFDHSEIIKDALNTLKH